MANDGDCLRCGHANPLGANFCSSCGNALESHRGPEATVTLPQDDVHERVDDVGVDLADVPEGQGALVVTRGKNAGSRWVLHEHVTRAGRHPDSDIFLDDVTVSRRHVDIIADGDGGYTVKDAGSLNGLYVNRQRVDEARLEVGDEVQIGSFKLIFVRGEG